MNLLNVMGLIGLVGSGCVKNGCLCGLLCDVLVVSSDVSVVCLVLYEMSLLFGLKYVVVNGCSGCLMMNVCCVVLIVFGVVLGLVVMSVR